MRTLLYTLTALLLVSSLGCKPDDKGKTPKTPEKTTETKKAPDAKKAPEKKAPEKKAPETKAPEGTQWVASATYGVKFRVPDDWNVKKEEDGISATDSDETTTVVLVGSQSTGTIQAAINDVKKKVQFKDAKLDKVSDIVLSGLPGQEVRGTAVIKKQDLDQEIQFIAYNVRVGKKSAVTMMIFSEAEMYEAKREIIEGLAKTLTKS